MNEDFVRWLGAMLEERGWSQSEAARRGRFSASMIQQVLGGITNPGPGFCSGVARAFGIPDDEVFRRAHILSPRMPPAGVDGLLQRLQQLPESDQEAIIGQMDALLRFAESRPVYDIRPQKPANQKP